MTIGRKLGLSFGVIVLLFGLNMAIYFWSASRRDRTVDVLHRAVHRQVLISSISQTLNNLNQQITFLSGIESSRAPATREERRDFAAQLVEVSNQIRQLEEFADPSDREEIEELQTTFQQLAKSWNRYYENFGVSPDVAIRELAVNSEPLRDQVLKHLVPHVRDAIGHSVNQGREDFSGVSKITDRVTVAIFLLSLLSAIVIAFRVSRELIGAINRLIQGTNVLSTGNLDHRIEIRTGDEVGRLSESFNAMANSLSAAQEKVTQRTHELEQTNRELGEKNAEVERQKQISEKLLLNILPSSVAEELQTKGSVAPKYFEDVTILFTDFVGFTKASAKLAVEELVQQLHEFFTTFDRIVKKYGLEKLKTIGDSYMGVGGIPLKNSSHPVDTVLAAFEILEALASWNQRTDASWSVRIGIHTGPVAAGVVGIDKFAFDVWGDTVNFAARLQVTSQPNRINISATTYSRVKDFFECEYRGKVETKEKTTFDMYFVNGLHADLQDGETSLSPVSFLRRYQIYFSKVPPAFPGSLLVRAPSLQP